MKPSSIYDQSGWPQLSMNVFRSSTVILRVAYCYYSYDANTVKKVKYVDLYSASLPNASNVLPLPVSWR